MKTTVELPDTLMREARKMAAREGITLKTVLERGLRRVLAEPVASVPFKLRSVTFKGRGLHPDTRSASVSELRALSYEGRGG
jgi:hypothetical protein